MTMNPTEQTPPAAYFGSLTIRNVKCFKDEQTIDLSDGDGKPALWTVILGNNNIGKTTLLRCLADLIPNRQGRPKIADKLHLFPVGISNDGANPVTISNVFLIQNNEFFSPITSGIKGYSKGNKRGRWQMMYRDNELKGFEIRVFCGYGTSRKMGNTSLSESENTDNTASLFDDTVTLTNTEEWLLQTFFAEKLGKPKAAETLERIKAVLTSGILPDVQEFRFDTTPDFKGFVEVKTDYGWIKLRELGYGYQVTLAWIVDLAKKLFERYPNSENPLHEPAIVLVDEIDLHLHPDWQRKIIQFLSSQFPKTQFIATTHSPLVVQSADNVNLVILEKQDDHVTIRQRNDIKSFKGWTVEEILSDLMGLDDKTLSDDYLKWMRQFDDGLDHDDYQKAKQAYDALDKILNPDNIAQRKLLRIQMAGLMAE
jgi:energy-coupling factor transporter ATP-binding protein EcfA2